MQTLLAAVLAFGVLIASCDGNGTTVGSGIEGSVTIGPMCPVVQEGTPCPDQPYQADVVVRDDAGDVITTFRSAEDGTFRVALKAGSYTLDPQSPDGASLPYAAPVDVVVRSGAYTHVDISYDSGIR